MINKVPLLRNRAESAIFVSPNYDNHHVRTCSDQVMHDYQKGDGWSFSHKYAILYKNVKDPENLDYTRFRNYTVRANYGN